MANNSRVNPMIVDTASSSRLVSDTTELQINAIAINASGDSWSVILKDGAGNIKFQATTPGPANDRFRFIRFTTPVFTTGLVVDTLTNITNVLIYTTP